MATDKIRTVAGVLRQAAQRRKTELEQRLAAERGPNNILLGPDALAGDYEPARRLYTTLGGDGPRVITEADLKAFKRAADKLGKKFKGGITARQAIALSLDDRRDRARGEIAYAIPLENRGARFHFITNTGPNSKVARRNVYIELLTLPTAVATAAKAADLAKRVAAAPLKFDCDCEDHRFRFRYIATVGGFNAGRPETGFPKITSPTLKGIACKHVLRVLQALGTVTVQRRLAEAIEAQRRTLAPRVRRTTEAELQAAVAEQQATAGRAPAAGAAPAAGTMPVKTKREAIRRAVATQRAAQGDNPLTEVERVKGKRSASALLAAGAIDRRLYESIIRRLDAR